MCELNTFQYDTVHYITIETCRFYCLLLSMNSTNETSLLDRFLIIYNLYVFHLYYLHFCISLYTCANVIYILNIYLLTYLCHFSNSVTCMQ